MKNVIVKFSWLELIICIAICLIVARYYFSSEWLSFENSLFQALGLSSNLKYLITVPVFGFAVYKIYRKSAVKGTPISKPVIWFLFVSLTVVIVYLITMVAGTNA